MHKKQPLSQEYEMSHSQSEKKDITCAESRYTWNNQKMQT